MEEIKTEILDEEETNEEDFDAPVLEEEPNPFNELYENSFSTIELLKNLDKKFETKIKVDEHKAVLFDNLHKELMDYKNGLVTQIINNILLDIIQLIDSNDKTLKMFEQKEFSEENYNKLINTLKGVTEDLTDILYRQSVEPFSIEETVNVKKQKIIKTISTSDKELDNKIAMNLAPGYEKDGKVIRPERIAIYKYKESEENISENE